MDGRRFLVAGIGVGFGVVAGSLVATATSIAQAPFNPRKEQTSAPFFFFFYFFFCNALRIIQQNVGLAFAESSQ